METFVKRKKSVSVGFKPSPEPFMQKGNVYMVSLFALKHYWQRIFSRVVGSEINVLSDKAHLTTVLLEFSSAGQIQSFWTHFGECLYDANKPIDPSDRPSHAGIRFEACVQGPAHSAA